MKLKQVKTKRSGIRGWQGRLKSVYADFSEFCHYNNVYGIAARLGYKVAANAWKANPIIEGSVNPRDLRRVRSNEKTKVK